MHVLGLDIGKDSIFAHLLLVDGRCHSLAAVPNTAIGFEQLLQWARKHQVGGAELHVVMEATGVYWESCAQHLYDQGCQVSVENPARIRYFAHSKSRRGKTDAMDAELIAQYGATMSPKVWQPPSPALHELKLLVRERSALLVTLNAEQNRLHAMNHRADAGTVLLGLIQQRVAFLKVQVQTLEKAMHALVGAHTSLSEPLHLLMTIPGYGFLSAASVLAETDGFALLETGTQISAYAGIAPAPFESGSSVHRRGRISKVGNAHLRRTAYLAALGAQRSKSRMGDFYRHLRAEGKPPKVALVALGRKLLRTGLAVVKSGQPYQEAYRRPQLPRPSGP
ncbi:IS110 family transposase [Deinococcus aquatilis]|uniref:IS110 family transposase n=1 Tax=Deinococcus aquatilis TaxID=519440 RepID=UPI0003AB3237|nr:IS110 family transposase [Deinococcus aquatilis]